jgi:hypothetical protein
MVLALDLDEENWRTLYFTKLKSRSFIFSERRSPGLDYWLQEGIKKPGDIVSSQATENVYCPRSYLVFNDISLRVPRSCC